MFRLADAVVHEITDQVTGRKVCINAGDVTTIHELDGGKAGIQLRGHTGVTVTVESYESVRDLFFPDLAEFDNRKTAAYERENARHEASVIARQKRRSALSAMNAENADGK